MTSWFTRLTVGYARSDEALRRGQQAFRLALGAFLREALSPAEREALAPPLYDATLRPESAHHDLWPWEQRWFARDLPPPPARVLVGGAGTGREVLALLADGYEVDACEPAPGLAAQLETEMEAALADRPVDQRRPEASGLRYGREPSGYTQPISYVGGGRPPLVLAADYDDWIRALSGDGGGPAQPLVGRRYDAVLLGWGSVHHVLRTEVHRALMRACDVLTPSGPILASFWMAEGLGGPARRAGGRASRLAGLVGAQVGRVRRLESGEGVEVFDPRYGFAHHFTRSEIEALATDVGRRVRWGPDDALCPHVSLVRGR